MLRAADRVPTLTEVVDLLHAQTPSRAVDPERAAAPVAGAALAAELSAEVLFEMEQRIDSHLESRLREALAPALARAADGMIREARQELAGALRELVEDAVTRALERRTQL